MFISNNLFQGLQKDELKLLLGSHGAPESAKKGTKDGEYIYDVPFHD
jgi:hypothetical protein